MVVLVVAPPWQVMTGHPTPEVSHTVYTAGYTPHISHPGRHDDDDETAHILAAALPSVL